MTARRSPWFESALLPAGWAERVRFEIEDGCILRIEPGCAAQPDDERHAIGLPGLSNLHSHAFQRGMAGLAEVRGPDRDSFWTWRETMYRFVERITPDDLEALAAQAYVEMLESGFVGVGEFHYLHHDVAGNPYGDVAEMADRIVAAAHATGIGLTLLPVFYAHAGFGAQPPSARQRRFTCGLDAYADLLAASRAKAARLPDAVVGVAPHSLRAVTFEELRQVAALAGTAPVHLHVAEQVQEVEECVAWSGRRPVEYLLGQMAVDRHWCLVHATHLTASETRDLAASGAVAGLCPITEANLGDGIFPALAYREAGGAFGIGSDSNVLIDAAEELRLLEYSQRLVHRGRNLLSAGAGASTGRCMFDAVRSGGAQALQRTGRGLECGAPFDAVSLRADHPTLVSRTGDAWLDAWIFGGGRSMIDCVWRRGEKVVADGRHAAREAIGARYRRCLGRLLA